jgi:hypothetical protein
MTHDDLKPYDPEEFRRFRESPVGQRIARAAYLPHPEDCPICAERDRCEACQAVTDAGKPTTCPECPERQREDFRRFRESHVGQRIAEIAAEPRPPNPAHGPACGVDFCLECWLESRDDEPETFEDQIGCDMCGAHIDDPCDCFDPQKERRTR